MKQINERIFRRVPVIVPVLLLLCLCFALGGCFKKTLGGTADTGRATQSGTPGKAAVAEFSVDGAEAALRAGDMARAERIATQLSSQQGLSNSDTARLSRVLAISSLANSRAYLSVTALERWRSVDSKADAEKEWQDTFLAALPQLSRYDGISRATAVVNDEKRPFILRASSALFLAKSQWERGSGSDALTSLTAMYAKAPDKNQRMAMEYSLFDALHLVNPPVLENLAGLVTPENSKIYPYALVRLEQIRRAGLAAGGADAAKAEVEALRADTKLAGTDIFTVWGAPASSSVTAAPVVPLSGRTLVLALPLSGSLGMIGNKVARGAEIARKEFAAANYDVGLVMLDTEKTDWLDKLASLPPNVTVVGGPLRAQEFAAAQARGLTGSRAFLTFMPTLGAAAEEGRGAWRFFPGPEDQMNALFRLTQELGVTSYAILMPDNQPYAERMADLFEQQARARGASVAVRSKYPGKSPETWNKFVGSFLGTSKNANHAPGVSYQAIFLPDTWKNMELIVPNLFYFRETRQVLLGTSLWEQGLTGNDHIDAHYYGMGVFPGAWNMEAPTQAAEYLQAAFAKAGYGEPDFWAGLGYDFVRFAATLDIPQGWTAGTVNAALSGHKAMPWSMAPIAWSPEGKASQQLFLFTPVNEGFVPADTEKIKARFNKAWKR